MFVFHYFFWPAKLKVAYSLSSECRIVLTTKHCTLLFHSTFISPLQLSTTWRSLEPWRKESLEHKSLIEELDIIPGMWHPSPPNYSCQLARVIKTVAKQVQEGKYNPKSWIYYTWIIGCFYWHYWARKKVCRIITVDKCMAKSLSWSRTREQRAQISRCPD